MKSNNFDPDAPGTGGGIYGLPSTPDDAGVVLVPVPWDATTSYRPGAAQGPAAILAASVQLDLEDREAGRPWEAGIAMLPIPDDLAALNAEARTLAEPILAAGGAGDDPSLRDALARVNAISERVNARVRADAVRFLDRGRLVGVVGGDHASPFGLIEAIVERHPGVGILHLDAHADLRDAYEGFTWSHASIMHNVATRLPGLGRLVQVGLRDVGRREMEMISARPEAIRAWFDADLQRALEDGTPWSELARRIVEDLPGEVHLSFDIDGLDPTLCPNTGTPVPGGLSFAQAVSLVRAVRESGRRIVGFDLDEVAPDPTGASEWDANVGMRLLYKMIGFALLSRR